MEFLVLLGNHLNWTIFWNLFLSPPVLMYGGLLCIALRLSVCTRNKVTRVSVCLSVRLSRSKVTWVNPNVKVIILAGGLTSTSSCIFRHFYTNVCENAELGHFWVDFGPLKKMFLPLKFEIFNLASTTNSWKVVEMMTLCNIISRAKMAKTYHTLYLILPILVIFYVN